MEEALLGGLSPQRFLRRHWQKRPLLVRRALPQFRGVIGKRALFALAARDDVESRLVEKRGKLWKVTHGPLPPQRLRNAKGAWTLLVNGINCYSAAAERLLRRFSFVPQARLDDLMVSYAAPGGGVGPHFDSYDVFLVQGEGQRRWRVSAQKDLDLVSGAPLKILRRFAADHEWIVRPGDVLYLPPDYAHEGVAVGECITYSIGFRAPAAQELAQRFLDFLHDRVALEGRYADPGLVPAREPARIPPALLDWSARTLERLRWSREIGR